MVAVDVLIYLKVKYFDITHQECGATPTSYLTTVFPDMDFDSSCLLSILNNGNLYESRVLKNHLDSKGLSLRNLLDTCCQKLDEGTYHCSDSRTSRMSSSTRTCYSCALRNFRDLAYLYRKDIPSEELPGMVIS